jgi:hypothetical protein
VIAALAVAAAAAAAEPAQPRLLAVRDRTVVRVDPELGGGSSVLPGTDAAWSSDGTRIVFARSGDLWTANADGSGVRRIVATPNVVESEPAWSPDGGAIVYTATVNGARQIRLVPADGSTVTRKLAPETGEAWSPSFSADSSRVSFLARPDTGRLELDTVGLDGRNPQAQVLVDERLGRPITDARDLDWSPGGARFAYTAVSDAGTAVVVEQRGGEPIFRSSSPSTDEHPVWSPDGTQLAYDTLLPSSVHVLHVLTLGTKSLRTIGTGSPLDWGTVPLGRPRFPDLVQRPPNGLVVTAGAHGRWLLGFTSLVDNRGPGILWIRGRRPPNAHVMDVSQLVQLAGGAARVVPGAGELHYTVAPPHYHWHLLHFDRYELRRAVDFALLVRDRKSGFCLADHYGIVPGMHHGRPRFLGDCAQFNPKARSVEEGSSVGYTDRYPANFHGQNLDITALPAGRYWLVHRVNGDFALREQRYDNDVAALLVRIDWPGGRRAAPHVTPLRACRRERC